MAGTLIAAVLYIGSTEMIQGIIPGSKLASSTAPFGLAFAHMFSPAVGKIVVAMMVVSCFGSLFSCSSRSRGRTVLPAGGYFPRLFMRATKSGVLISGHLDHDRAEPRSR